MFCIWGKSSIMSKIWEEKNGLKLSRDKEIEFREKTLNELIFTQIITIYFPITNYSSHLDLFISNKVTNSTNGIMRSHHFGKRIHCWAP